MMATRIVHVSIPLEAGTLVIASAGLRSYLGLSRDGTYLHHVRPARLDDPIVGDGLRQAGQLTCDCHGGRFRGVCYWVKAAETFETGGAAPDPEEWFATAAPGELAEAFGR